MAVPCVDAEECWSKAPDSPALLRRLGNGLMSLPRHFADYNLAKEVLLKSEELSSHAISYHILGTFYFKYEQDIVKAKEYYKKAADHGLIYGYNELIRLKYLSDPDYDPYEDLKEEESAMKFSSSLDNVNCDLGWYYLFFKRDLPKALEYFWKVIEKDEESILLTSYTSKSLLVHPPINLYSLLVNEALLFKRNKSQHNKENCNIVNNFLEKVQMIHPELLIMTPNSDVMNYVRKRTEKFILNSRRKMKASKRKS